ncbi:MAG: insulinase family protein, partial [Pseudomonadota bacterium]
MKRFHLALLVPIICLSTAVVAQIAPLPNFPQDRYSEFKADASVKYGTLPNGVRYAIQKWPTPKNEVSIRMRIGAGALNEAENQRGLMHFLEHMAFNGSTNVPEN